ncbi:TPA: efflux RND transporter periplasmic adaptor subunit [Burkholderia aenigmatica]|uniref:efflux RND transporter periplasmic adaptor subunit n=1 Tax=Burkholderia sp. AU45251 TaxID=3059204 RepID=UPI00264C45C9|nr:efflux RND transporter periplasmic adaptor subunit [Burkholderia sp. AU45251]HDR9487570.1 efflux RND transporter periplasmic adaptor subunit [Burkholderia aenigmatica]MDN7520429.1 efflux RND transporter periplasmic adaptor subunit [Burkholderia sp. AU45251]HDR9519348.1 efflux RND transporter periplasmic adaptor subunit [Burkholderia aenigmatica]HDR9596378.1 efflux RND transporter periplasmic adaptor subunit [Burkholderia aenigmatica]HDR9603633.1 efflux RND transporter periplasmic adaptor su
MTKQTRARAALLAFAGAALLGAGYFAGMRHAATAATATDTTGSTSIAKTDPKTGRKVLYWHDPMVPNQHFDKPGKSPFMDMQLQPVYADEGGGASGIRIDPGLQQNLGIRFATVHRQQTAAGFDAVGTTQFDESRADVVQSRVTGYIDRLYARAPMQRIAKGAPVASLFVPDWLAPQEEYLALRRGGMDGSLLDAARARMRALSIPDGMIASLERTGRVQTHVVLSAPETGVVSELNVRDGAMVAPGQTLAKIAGLSTLWLIVEVPEALALNVQPGMPVDATFAGDPTRHFTGRIREVLPGISTSSRTLQARVELDNTALKLTPGMLMRVQVAARQTVSRLLVPSEAVIATGKRSIVIVKNRDGRLQPATVTVGNDVGSDTEVLGGLSEGDTVVASGQFLIDSEASLKSVLPRLARDSGASTAAAPIYETTGKVEQVTADDITFSHRPVPALGWGAMTMAFGKPSAGAFPDVKPGQTVRFAFTPSDDGYRLTKVEPQGGER